MLDVGQEAKQALQVCFPKREARVPLAIGWLSHATDSFVVDMVRVNLGATGDAA